jgi:Domain of unknown function (DUF4189)
MLALKAISRIGAGSLISGALAFTLLAAAHAQTVPGYYGATAVGISGNRVGVGYSTNFTTQAAADTKALQECAARTGNCQIAGRFWNGGCGYVTTAVSSGTCYGFGATATAALLQCQSRGCTCQKPVGGCTKAP